MSAGEQKADLKKVTTSFIVKNLQMLVKNYDKRSPHWADAIREYDIFMGNNRSQWTARANNDYKQLLKNEEFIQAIREVLAAFGMDSRASVLTSLSLFLETTRKVSRDFDLLARANVKLENLELKNKIEVETVASIISRIYGLFSQTGKLSVSGGMVIASKAMHMLMPELFIMIDHRIMGVLHGIPDYYPHPRDGKNWYDIIPGYSGAKLNPYAGYGWDSDQCYLAALMYYKRIIREWCQQNNKDVIGFSELGTRTVKVDGLFGNKISFKATAARIIDMALW